MEENKVLLEKQGHIAVVSINRPKALNALNSEVLVALDEVIGQVEADEDIYVVILTGSGEKSFVAGADIAEMKDMTPMQARRFSNLGNRIFRRLEQLEKPVIAAVNGFALGGGCELALACDIRIASEKARFGQPEVGLGITPGFGGTQRLARTVGIAKAKEMLYTGRPVKADEALAIGLANKVVAPEELMNEAQAMAAAIAANAPVAVRLCKAAVNRGMQVDLDTALALEAEVFAECFATEDQTEGMTAFVEKRQEKNFQNK